MVASDNEKNAAWATEELVKAIGGRGEVGLLTYHYNSYYSIAARRDGFQKTLAAHPGVQLVATDRFLQPREAYDKTIAMLRAILTSRGSSQCGAIPPCRRWPPPRRWAGTTWW